MTMPQGILPVVLSAGATAAASVAWVVRSRRQSMEDLRLKPRETPKRDSVLDDLHAAGRWSK
ncbi:hypothetical protein JOF56_004735 [Kibdelosporangium banguiense]|uniref:Secreted protein n=1 Tax=Kibdelosporangium banguiense TaxID=1365924 RepID=A0ABS4TK09_9PSEU|nr:hypothetical protein [Kibdelosporangium banguiense]MBP2324350.1 hypothetical protein [Kibdelosporangium banguiense]